MKKYKDKTTTPKTNGRQQQMPVLNPSLDMRRSRALQASSNTPLFLSGLPPPATPPSPPDQAMAALHSALSPFAVPDRARTPPALRGDVLPIELDSPLGTEPPMHSGSARQASR